MLFCPCCGNLLLIELAGDVQFYCKTCSYRYTLSGQISRSLTLTRKSVDPVLGGETAWQGADKTHNPCPICMFPEAFWIQMQIRSSDEPMSRFYRCCQCAHQWREDWITGIVQHRKHPFVDSTGESGDKSSKKSTVHEPRYWGASSRA